MTFQFFPGELRLDFPRAADVKESLECLTNFTGILSLILMEILINRKFEDFSRYHKFLLTICST